MDNDTTVSLIRRIQMMIQLDLTYEEIMVQCSDEDRGPVFLAYHGAKILNKDHEDFLASLKD